MKPLTYGTPVVDASNIWRRGLVVDESEPDDAGKIVYSVLYDNDPLRRRYERLRGDLLSADDAYINSDGMRLGPMTFPDAVRSVYVMATGSAGGLAKTSGDDLMAQQLESAIETLEHVFDHAGVTADFGPRPVVAQEWPHTMVGCERSLDPAMPSEALRICIAAAQELKLEMAGSAERSQLAQAISVAQDLVALYARKLNELRPLPCNVVAFPAA